jgi:RND superfamily putative drug exporter
VIARRVDATRAWYRLGSTREAVEDALDAAATARAVAESSGRRAAEPFTDSIPWATATIDPDTPFAELEPLERLLVAAAAALAEDPRALVLDLDAASASNPRTWRALAELVPDDVALIATAPADADPTPARVAFDARGIRELDLAARPEEALR